MTMADEAPTTATQAISEAINETPSSSVTQRAETEPLLPKQQTTSVPSDQLPTNPNEERLIEEMQKFDNLLKMMSVFRDNPDLRGSTDNIEEIAKVLAGLVGDDPDGLLDSDDGEDKDSEEQVANGEQHEADSNGDLEDKKSNNNQVPGSHDASMNEATKQTS